MKISAVILLFAASLAIAAPVAAPEGSDLEARWGRFGSKEAEDAPEKRWGRFGSKEEEDAPEKRWGRFGSKEEEDASA